MLKRLRQGLILKIVADQEVHSQDGLRNLLRQRHLRVTQATLSRDLHELGLVKTAHGYRPLAAAGFAFEPQVKAEKRLNYGFEHVRRERTNARHRAVSQAHA